MSTSDYIKHPYRWARKQLRLIGARPLERNADGIDFQLPNGGALHLSKRVNGAAAIEIVAGARRRLGHRGRIRMTRDAPKVDIYRIRTSDHAVERWRLMVDQANLAWAEFEDALLRPLSYEAVHGDRWVFRAERVALVLAFDNGLTHIITVMWATDELAAAYPRPETKTAPAATGA